MFNLLQLFLKLGSFFVFLLLEIICFSLVVKYNQHQSEVYVNSVNRLTGGIQKKSSSAYQYFQLYDENRRLAKENARLLDRLANLGINLQGTIDTAWAADTALPKYTFMDATIIKNSINQHHNYIVLDKGAEDGVTEHSGVVGENGVIGIVRKVSTHYSVAMSILHRETKISARLKNKKYFGSLVWKSTDIHVFNLEDITKDAVVANGDTVETSGYSAIFPPGIPLGVVEKMRLEPGSNFFTIEVRSFLDIGTIQHAYVVRNILKQEQEQLEKAVLEEDE